MHPSHPDYSDSAMHYAAMAGALPAVDFLSARGLTADEAAAVSGVTPLQVALEYKRLPAARRLQQLRDQARKSTAGQQDAPEPANSPAAPPSSSPTRPLPRFPSWILASATNGGLDVAELEGVGASVEAEAARLVTRSVPFVWRRAALCTAFPKVMQQLLKLRSQTLDTNIARCNDWNACCSPNAPVPRSVLTYPDTRTRTSHAGVQVRRPQVCLLQP